MRRVAPGPGFWCTPADLHHARDLGLASRLSPLLISCQAAMLRMHAWEDRANRGIRWTGFASALAAARQQSYFIVRAARWKSWLDRHTPTMIKSVVAQNKERGISIARAREELGGIVCGPLTKQASARFRRHTQRWFTARLLERDGYNVENRLRSRLHRWRLPGFPGRTARIVIAQLARLRRLVPPRLRAATLSTIMNRWVTDRRMRGVSGTRRACVLGCSATADDAIEHYFCCPVWRDWLRRRLGTASSQHGLVHGVLATKMSDKTLQLQAVATYVLYRTVNHIRHRPLGAETAWREFLQHYFDQQRHEAARGHPKLQKCCKEAAFEASRKRPFAL